MTIGSGRMGEQPIFSTKAHVFHIDPKTKKSWIPASNSAINVSFFFDSTRNLYRIISVEGTKAVINSTITPNMTFTKTSQKFGQWSDVRANTVYGLGFSTEADLNKFIEKFQEVKEATRITAQKSQATNGNANVTPVTSASASPISGRSIRAPDDIGSVGLVNPPVMVSTGSSMGTSDQLINANTIPNDMVNASLLKSSLVAHQRSQSLSGLQQPVDSPKHQTPKLAAGDMKGSATGMSVSSLPTATAEAQLKYENDRLKLALAQSSANAKKWEVELQTLKNNNARLTSALQESTANVEEWKRQLQSYKDDNNKMKIRVLEMEASRGSTEAAVELRKEMASVRGRADVIELEMHSRDQEIQRLNKRIQELLHLEEAKHRSDELVKVLQDENETLKTSVLALQEQLETALATQETGRRLMEALHAQLGDKLHEVAEIQREIGTAIST